MKTKYIIGLLFIFISSLAIAQNHITPVMYNVKGYVNYDRINTNYTSIYVTIYGNNKLFQTSIDSSGYFYLENIDSGYYNIIINSNNGDKTFDSFSADYENTEVIFEISELSYPCILQRTSCTISKIRIYPKIQEAPNQQIEALAAYARGVDYRYSNTINFGNNNEIIIGK